MSDGRFPEIGAGEWGGRATIVRYHVLAAACAMAVITYIHRVGFATASAEFKGSMGLSDGQISDLMVAFMLGYGLFEIPWGFLGDRFGVRNLLAIIILGGSMFTACLALVAFFPQNVAFLIMPYLLLLRFLFGAFQAGTFPSISRMMADWMPTTERGSAQGAIWMSSRLGGALAPLLFAGLFAVSRDWKPPLVVVAVLGVTWCALFWPWFRSRPEEMRQVNHEELALIQKGRAARPAQGIRMCRGPGSCERLACGRSVPCTDSSGSAATFT